MSTCPNCFKKLPVMEKVYENYRTDGVPARKQIGATPALNRYKPFCTLRCGWRWARAHQGVV